MLGPILVARVSVNIISLRISSNKGKHSVTASINGPTDEGDRRYSIKHRVRVAIG